MNSNSNKFKLQIKFTFITKQKYSCGENSSNHKRLFAKKRRICILNFITVYTHLFMAKEDTQNEIKKSEMKSSKGEMSREMIFSPVTSPI